jgi:hypothetical protein
MKRFPNECSYCGRPATNKNGCAHHKYTPTMHCMTAGKDELQGVVERAEKRGFRRYGDAVAVWHGNFVQLMIEG